LLVHLSAASTRYLVHVAADCWTDGQTNVLLYFSRRLILSVTHPHTRVSPLSHQITLHRVIHEKC